MVAVQTEELVVRFGATTTLGGVDLSVEPGELFLLLGPSGSGKTTLLRAVAGFVPIASGRVRFDGVDVTHRPAHERNTGMVFQSFALFPHMNVLENVAFGLRERKVTRAEIARRVEAALASVRLETYADRPVDQLSGGQQQRVALARALVVEPACLLLDEPLSNLDANLRHSMRSEIRRVCKERGITTLYVTHDQKEALAIADRIAVLFGGRIAQIGPPLELYRHPATREVAEFIGETNLVAGRVVEVSSAGYLVDTPLGRLRSAADRAPKHAVGDSVCVSMRPECFALRDAGDAPNVVSGRITRTSYLGEMAEHELEVGPIRIRIYELNPGEVGARPDRRAAIAPGDVVLLPKRDGDGPA